MIETVIIINENTSITKLITSDGMVLTNNEAYGKEIFLGINDSPNNWHEITDAEYEEIILAQMPSQTNVDVDIFELQQKAKAYDIRMGVGE